MPEGPVPKTVSASAYESNLLQLQIKWKPSNFNTIYSVKINYRVQKSAFALNPLISQLQEKRFSDYSSPRYFSNFNFNKQKSIPALDATAQS